MIIYIVSIYSEIYIVVTNPVTSGNYNNWLKMPVNMASFVTF